MSRVALVRQAELTRAINAAKAAGMKPTRLSVASDGSIHLSFVDSAASPVNSFDNLQDAKS